MIHEFKLVFLSDIFQSEKFIKSLINSLEQPPDVKEMKMLSDNTKLQMIFINQSLEKSLLITTHGCVSKECMLLVPKVPVRSG